MEDIQAIKQRMEQLIGQTIPSSVMDPTPYKCEICQDSGWIHTTDENGYRFSRKCRCKLAREAEERLEASGLAEAVQQQTFDSFEVHTETQAMIKQTAERYLEALSDPEIRHNPRRPWLYIGGNPGCGKTHICTAICGQILKQNIGVRYMQWVEEARKLKACVNDDDFEDQVQEYISVSLLYIDDLLKQKYTPDPRFTEADIKIAFTILNNRYLMNKPTIISSEWDLIEQLLPADEGVFSRVYERCKGYTVSIGRDPANNYRLMQKTG